MTSSPMYPDVNLPSDKLANLRSISLHKLQTGSVSEQDLLVRTCIEDGFFLLDLTHPSLSTLLSNVDNVFKLSKDVFNYPPEIKALFDVDTVSDLKTNGYKPKGRNIVAKSGKSDGFESWVVRQPQILSSQPKGNAILIYWRHYSSHVTDSFNYQTTLSHTPQRSPVTSPRSAVCSRVSVLLPIQFLAPSPPRFPCQLASASRTFSACHAHLPIFCVYSSITLTLIPIAFLRRRTPTSAV